MKRPILSLGVAQTYFLFIIYVLSAEVQYKYLRMQLHFIFPFPAFRSIGISNFYKQSPRGPIVICWLLLNSQKLVNQVSKNVMWNKI